MFEKEIITCFTLAVIDFWELNCAACILLKSGTTLDFILLSFTLD